MIYQHLLAKKLGIKYKKQRNLEEINQNESNEIIKLKNFAIQKALKRLVFKKFQEYRSAGTGEHFSSKIGVQVLLKDEENLKELLNLTKEEIIKNKSDINNLYPDADRMLNDLNIKEIPIKRIFLTHLPPL